MRKLISTFYAARQFTCLSTRYELAPGGLAWARALPPHTATCGPLNIHYAPTVIIAIMIMKIMFELNARKRVDSGDTAELC